MQRDCAKQTKPQNSSKTGPPPKIAYTMLLRETETLTENHLRLKDPHPTLCPSLTRKRQMEKRSVVYATRWHSSGRFIGCICNHQAAHCICDTIASCIVADSLKCAYAHHCPDWQSFIVGRWAIRDTEHVDCICNAIAQNRWNLRIPLRLGHPHKLHIQCDCAKQKPSQKII